MSDTRRRRRWTSVALLALLAVVATACAKEEGAGEEVREILEVTASEPHRFVYRETTPTGGDTVVQGIVEDDFRTSARLLVDGDPVLERIVSDDLAAVRFVQPELLGVYIDKEVVSSIDTETDLEGIDVFTALQSRRWVVDPGGAPPLLRSADDVSDSGVDPMSDARQMLARARELTFLEGGGFLKFRPTSISPTYRRDEDPFPIPEEGSGVDRYDLPQPPFPRRVEGSQLAVPGDPFFRKFSVYVKDGRVIRVAEEVGLSPSVLDDFEVFMTQLVVETAPRDVREGFVATVEQLEGQELAGFLLEALNTVRDLQGDPPVRFRTATYELLDVGDSDIRVEEPTGELITADLAVLVNLGVKPTGDLDAAESDPAADS